MGIPVIAGAAPDTLAAMGKQFGTIPFLVTDEGGIYEALLSLATASARTRWANLGLEHVNRWHSQKAVVDMLTEVYEQVLR
jgi:hypothetical protein